MIPANFRIPLQKVEWLSYLHTIVCSFVWTKHRNMTDGQTDGQADIVWLVQRIICSLDVHRHRMVLTWSMLKVSICQMRICGYEPENGDVWDAVRKQRMSVSMVSRSFFATEHCSHNYRVLIMWDITCHLKTFVHTWAIEHRQKVNLYYSQLHCTFLHIHRTNVRTFS